MFYLFYLSGLLCISNRISSNNTFPNQTDIQVVKFETETLANARFDAFQSHFTFFASQNGTKRFWRVVQRRSNASSKCQCDQIWRNLPFCHKLKWPWQFYEGLCNFWQKLLLTLLSFVYNWAIFHGSKWTKNENYNSHLVTLPGSNLLSLFSGESPPTI